MNQCEQHFILHEQQLKDNKDNITHIYSMVEGLPQKIENLEKNTETNINRLCLSISELVTEMRSNYLTKDLYEVKQKTTDNQITDLKGIIRWLVYGLVGCLITVLWDLSKIMLGG